MRNENQGTPRRTNRFWVKVAGVGLIAGLIGGGIAIGIGGAIQHHEAVVSTRVPSGSNRAGGTKVNKNKADLNGEATRAYNSVQGAVVSVINKQNVQQDNGILGMFGPTQGDNSSSSSSNGKLETASEGSGVIYKKSGNAAYIVTNNHVVKGSSALQVIMSNGRKVDAQLVGTDAATDLAVLKINSANVTTVAGFGNSNSITAGQDVLAIGSPMGSEYANTVTKGIVSAKNRTLKAGTDGTLTSVIQTDAAINSGNSGGPLINMAGQVIGINSMKLSSDNQGSSIEGMGFAIPSNEVTRVINQIVKHGRVIRPRLGILYTDLANISAKQRQSVLKLPKNVNQGSVIMDVKPGSAAQKAGLKKYDVITKMAGQQIHGLAQLRDILYAHKIGQRISITYYQGGHVHQTTVKLVP
ncbi:S1C family serine protease [Limosilactobacillus sp.]|uniref:S1C family serine protease n=1 Tax=Limosilactobacillus sp. TaxID=2773925 RepID=UPI0035A0BF57